MKSTYFHYYFPFEKGMTLHINTFNLFPDCLKFDFKEIFKILSVDLF